MEQASATDRKIPKYFNVYFNNRKQYIRVYLENVSPDTFQKRGGGRWGYFLATWKNKRLGLFGEIHLATSRIRLDTVVHETYHAVDEHRRTNRKSEEFYAKLITELYTKIERKLKKLGLI